MAAEKDFELLDDYLANKLPDGERAAFEKNIENDVQLQKELKLQQNLIESLRRTRVAELKAMLNNVPISPVGTSTLVSKVAIGLAVTAVISTAIYFSLADKDKVESTSEIQDLASQKPPSPTPSDEPLRKEQLLATVEDEEKKEIATAEKKTRRKNKEKKNSPLVVEPKIEVFDPTTELEEEDRSTEKDVLSDDDQISTGEATILVDIDSTNRRHTFHYKMEQDQLTLYGPFERNLFEILEFFSDSKRTAFLYYKKSYYYIKEVDKTTALVPVQDPALLNKLRKHRTGNK